MLSPTYGEFARVAAHVGHQVSEVTDIAALASADLAIVANPNNPDGRLFARDALLRLADELQRRRGLLIVDEAFMDVAPDGLALDDCAHGNVLVLRSFGKFFGLAGVRLGFALGAPELVARLATTLGPWPVSGSGDRNRSGRACRCHLGGRHAHGVLPMKCGALKHCSRAPGSKRSAARRSFIWCARPAPPISFSISVAPASWCAVLTRSLRGSDLVFPAMRLPGSACVSRFAVFR